MFHDEFLRCVEESVLCWLATVDARGQPNVSPKEVFCVHGGSQIFVANIASPNSVKNIKENRNVCLSFINIFKQKGYKVKGEANVYSSGEEFYKKHGTEIIKLAGDKFVVKNLIVIDAKEISEVLAPSYVFYPKTTVKDQIDSALDRYGVLPKD